MAETPWSNNANAPNVTSVAYIAEKNFFTRASIKGILYGIVITLFFYCISALLNPINNVKRNMKWALVAHISVMLVLLTIPVTIDLVTESYSYVDNRGLPAILDSVLPGLNQGVATVLNVAGYPLNQWLADGLLLYRCHIIYAMNYRATAFPSLIYIGTVAIGAIYIHEYVTEPSSGLTPLGISIQTSYYSSCLALNITLMTMIIVRLVLHSRAMRKALGPSATTNRLYLTIVTILIESFALYTLSLLLFVPLWSTSSAACVPVSGIIGPAQVIASYLIILRVANRKAVTSEEITSANAGSIHFGSSGGWTSGEGTFSDEIPISIVDVNWKPPGGNSVGMGGHNVVEEVPLR